MIALPLPLIFAAVIAYLLLADLRSGRPLRIFHALLALCALQSALNALAHYYGLPLGPLMPVTACALPPLAWLAFRDALIEDVTPARALPHAAAPLLALLARIAAPAVLDALVPLTFAAYALAILWALRSDSPLPRARLDAGPMPAHTWRALAFALLLSTLGDIAISVGYVTGHPEWHGPIVSLVTSASLLLIALLSLDRNAQGVPEADPDAQPATSTPTDRATNGADDDAADKAEDSALLARLDALMTDEKLYLEPDLTLARLARRLRVPAKRLSTAINRAHGENVSRYVNGFRIRHACGLLTDGANVTDAIYASGFNTKSNFNREFLRVTGKAPSAWVG